MSGRPRLFVHAAIHRRGYGDDETVADGLRVIARIRIAVTISNAYADTDTHPDADAHAVTRAVRFRSG